jgi:predicted transcriptional regulator
MKAVTHTKLKAKLLKRSGFKNEYDKLDAEFTLIHEMLHQRYDLGITQAQLAKKMGTKQSAIARFESGRSNPTLDFIKRLADALDLELKISVRKSATI